MFDDSKVSFEIEVEGSDVEVRGNAMCSGDADADREYEDAIIARINDGDVWAWALVRVVARYDGIDDAYGDDYLSGCSYADEDDFKADGYYEDMCEVAKKELYTVLELRADKLGLDELIDPYEGDPCNEIADLATEFNSDFCKDGRVYAEYHDDGFHLRLTGTVERVLTVLRAAHGRA